MPLDTYYKIRKRVVNLMTLIYVFIAFILLTPAALVFGAKDDPELIINGCKYDPAKVSLTAYIINEDNSKVFAGSQLTKVQEVEPNRHLVKFDNGLTSLDFNDVWLKIDHTQLDQYVISVLNANDQIHHQIYLQLYYNRGLKKDLLLWSNSVWAVGRSKVIDLNKYQDLCSI